MRPQAAARAFLIVTLLVSLPFPAHALRPSQVPGVVPHVIVTDTTLVSAFAPLAAAHGSAGLASTIRTVQGIRADYPSGRDDAESIRMFLQDARANWQTRFVLLGGDDPLVPIRRVFLRLDQISSLPVQFLPTDQYYACLAGDWNADGDSLWGESPQPDLGEVGDDMSFVPDLAVGRAPVTSAAEAQVFVQKTLAAMNAATANGPISVLLTGAGDAYPVPRVDFAMFSEELLPLFTAHPENHVARLYEFPASWPGSFQATRASMLDSLERGYDVLTLYGPGGPGVFAAGIQSQDNLVAADLAALTNARPMCVFAPSPYTNQPGTFSIGAALLRAPRGGAAAVVGPADLQLIGVSMRFVKDIVERIYGPEVLASEAPTIGEALSSTIADYAPPSELARPTTQGNLLLGDPALMAPGTGDAATPVALALVSAIAEHDVVRLTWLASGGAGPVADVERGTPVSAWTRLETVTPDGSGRFVVEDRDVIPGGRYGYRLAFTEGDARRYAGETWVTVPPAPALALAGPRPNPATHGLAIAFSLPDAAAARLEVLDIAGRVIRAREVGGLGAGSHVVDLAEGQMPPPGVYVVRLTRAGASLVRRACVVR